MQRRDAVRAKHDALRKQRLDEFMAGFRIIGMKLKEMYQMITLGGGEFISFDIEWTYLRVIVNILSLIMHSFHLPSIFL